MVKVTHNWTKATIALPDHVVITAAYELHDNHLDHEARFTCSGTIHIMAKQFEGAWKTYLVNANKRFTRFANHAKAAAKKLDAPKSVPASDQDKALIQESIAAAQTERNHEANESTKRKLAKNEEDKKKAQESVSCKPYEQPSIFSINIHTTGIVIKLGK